MMNARKLLPSGLVLGLLAGCAMPASLVPNGHATLLITPHPENGGLRVQADQSPYTVSSINHLVVKLFLLSNGTEMPKLDGNGSPVATDIPNAQLGAPVTFSNLAPNTTYRIRAYAYADAGTATLISTTDSASYVDVTVTNDDRSTSTSLPVKLIDRVFSGQSTAPIALIPGGLVSSGSAQGSPAWGVTTIGSGLIAASLAVDGNGSIYMADSTNSLIKRMDASGNNLTTLGSGFQNPFGVAVDGNGTLYVADTNNSLIKRMDAGGNNLTTLGSGFQLPTGVAVDATGSIYVADMGGIKRMDASGNNITVLSPSQYCWAVAVDASGNVYASDRNNGTIIRIDANSHLQTTVYSGLKNPAGITVDKSGYLYVGDSGNSRVLRMDATGHNLTTLLGGVYASTVAVDNLGNVYAFDGNTNAVDRLQ